MARPREFDEAAVVQQAMGVFWRNGYQGTSIQDLVEATGLLRGSLYAAFEDKHGLFLRCLDQYAQMHLERIETQLMTGDDPLEALRAFVRQAGSDAMKPTFAERGCLVGNTCSELAADDPDARRRVAEFVTAMQRRMADGLRRAQTLGTFGADRDADATATFIQCSLQGLSLLARTRPKRAVIDGVVDEILRVLD